MLDPESETGVASCAVSASFTLADDETERQALLPKTVSPTPLPLRQLAIICYCALAEPVAFSQIFPYINQMVEELHVTDKATVGFYSGMVDSLFSFAQLCTVFQWGHLSDRIGRKPVITSGLIGVAVASLFFGLSTRFWQVVLFRAMAGALSGNIAVIQSMLSEITDETNQAQAFPLLGLTSCLGIVIGPLIGGSLSHPSERYPSLFGGFLILQRHPYFLPCLVSSWLTLSSIICAVFFLKETAPSKVRKDALDAYKDNPSHIEYGTISIKPNPPPVRPEPPPFRTLLLNPQVRRVLCVGFFNALSSIAWETVFVLFAYTPTSLGGLERKPGQIGLLLSVVGTTGMFISPVLFPAFQRRLGTLSVYRGCMVAWIVVFILFVPTGQLARQVTHSSEDGLGVAWIGVGLILTCGRLASMSFLAHMIMLKTAAPSKEAVGSMFGLSVTVASTARAFGPAFVSSLYAFSVDRHLLQGNFVWLVMVLVATIGYMCARTL